MNELSGFKSIFRKPTYIPLRYRFIFLTAGMLVVLLGSLALILGYLQSRTIRQQLQNRGLAIAQNLASIAATDLLTYNYVALERSANRTVQSPDIIYTIFHDKEGRVAGFSGRPDLQNTFLPDEKSKKALQAVAPLTQRVFIDALNLTGIDIAVPVFPPSVKEKWGTVRVCISLMPMYRQIRQVYTAILIIGLLAIMVGTLVSIWVAQRITRPLNNLVQGTQEAARGNLDQKIDIKTSDEIEILAANFSTMMREIRSHRMRLEEQLVEIKRLQRYTDNLLNTMSDGLLAVDTTGKLSTVNPSAKALFNRMGIDIGPEISLIDAAKVYPSLDEIFDAVLKKPRDRRPQEIVLPGKSGDHVLLIGTSVLRNRSGLTQEIIFNMNDISELKQMEASVRQAERLAALGTLSAGMAHEIRNPLSSIKTFVQLLPRKVDKRGFLEKFNRTVPRELNRINDLVEDLLELARVPKYQFKAVDLAHLLYETIDFIEEELQVQSIQCDTDIASDLPLVQADADQVIKAFQNLIRNAIQAMPEGGTLTVKASSHKVENNTDQLKPGQKYQLILVFKDTGSGIPSKDLDNIFNPFFTTKIKGTGLGLAIAHKVITEHHGQIFANNCQGHGAQFTIYLPA